MAGHNPNVDPQVNCGKGITHQWKTPNKKEPTTDACPNLGKFQKLCDEQRKPHTQESYWRSPNILSSRIGEANETDIKQVSSCLGLGIRGLLSK